MSLWMPERRRRLGGLSLAIALILVAGACSSSSTPVPAAPSVPGTSSAATAAPSVPASAAPSAAASPSSAPTAPPVGGTGSAEKWCAFVIEINTKYGYMKDKTYSLTPPTADVWRQIITEAMSRVDEWRAVTPPEIMDATTAEIAWFQAMKAYGDVHGWTSLTGFPQVNAAQMNAMAVLTPYQETHCGIKFGG
jgi:hypothetical protein